jgi:hypothetical protein
MHPFLVATLAIFNAGKAAKAGRFMKNHRHKLFLSASEASGYAPAREAVSIASPRGTWFVMANTFPRQLWRSADSGASWQLVPDNLSENRAELSAGNPPSK